MPNPEPNTMSWNKRSKLVFDMFHNFASAKSPLLAPKSGHLPDQWKTGWSLLCSRFGHQGQAANRVLPCARTYSSSSSRGFKIAVFAGAALTICYNLETCPYSGRTHLVLVPKYLEQKLGESKINKIMVEFQGDVLPPDHPDAARVRLIAKSVIESPIDELRYFGTRDCSLAPVYPNWEVTVIDRPIVGACCYGGKIVIYTGLLNRLESDAEIATVIGHEVGHDLARHAAVKITRKPWLACRALFCWFIFEDLCFPMGDDCIKQPCFRKLEREADFIGLLLMASAGYDPCVAPTVYDRLSDDMVVVSDYCSEYPTARKRASLLSRPEVMDEAKYLYYNARILGYGKQECHPPTPV